MDRKEAFKYIIQRTMLIPFGKMHYYPSIPDKVRDKVIKSFDVNLDFDHVIAFYDSTLFGNNKNGMLFTISGAYYLCDFEKPFYFNYEDINNIIIIPDKKGRYFGIDAQLNISFSNGKSLNIGSDDFYKENIRELLYTIKKQFSKSTG